MKSTNYLDNLNIAVRENPVAAGLIGLGLTWIVLGKSGSLVGQTGVSRSAKRAIDKTVDDAAGAVSQAKKAASGLKDALSQGVETKISNAMEGLKTSQNEPKIQSEFERHFPLPSSGGLAALLDRQPLALAAIGVAVGAAIASAFPSTDVEGRLMGTAGDKLKKTMAAATDTVADKIAAGAGEAADEATAQKLTPEAVKDAVRSGAAKVRTVVEAGLESLSK